MTAVMQGIRIIEVAEHAFVPGASALLADWGAEVIKIEPIERGDAGRGLNNVGSSDVNVMFHHANRGKRSLALDLTQDEGRNILYRLVADAHVFLTNKLPAVRKKLRIDVEDIRSHNPDIIYARGSGQGERGAEADRGAYDLLTYWHRSGASLCVASPDGLIPFLPAPGFGDFTGAMFIAGGIMGALFNFQRTGETAIVDASLLATGMWSMGAAVAVADKNPEWSWPPPVRNPLSAIYQTSDNKWVALCCLQAGYYWPLLCEALGAKDLATDLRFASHELIFSNNEAASTELREIFGGHNEAHWRSKLEDFCGQWTIVQNYRDIMQDPQVAANGYVQNCRSAGGEDFFLVTAPIQFNETAAAPQRGPDFNEHGDEILNELGLDWEQIIELKMKNVVG